MEEEVDAAKPAATGILVRTRLAFIETRSRTTLELLRHRHSSLRGTGRTMHGGATTSRLWPS
jgi:hypothetical protein